MNHRIRVPQVRLIDAQGNMSGIVGTNEALAMARKSGLDLVEIAANADPPVCRIMDYGKFKYETSRQEREARKKQHAAELKEVKLHANTGAHDLETKLKQIRGFLQDGDKVKISLYFRGRENAHRELGFALIKQVLAACQDVSVVDMLPKLMGNSLIAIIGSKSAKHGGGSPTAAASPRPSAPAGAPVNSLAIPHKVSTAAAGSRVASPASKPAPNPDSNAATVPSAAPIKIVAAVAPGVTPAGTNPGPVPSAAPVSSAAPPSPSEKSLAPVTSAAPISIIPAAATSVTPVETNPSPILSAEPTPAPAAPIE